MTSGLALLERDARRACVCGESGFALITRARFQVRCPASRSAASLAPAKFGIRPSAPGKRETPSRSIAFQTARLTWSLERICARILWTARWRAERTSLSPWPRRAASQRRAIERATRELLPERRPAERDARPAARDRARAPAQRLGPLGAGRGRSWTRPWSSSSTATGSAPRSRGSRTCPPRAARCSSPTTPARCRPTRR